MSQVKILNDLLLPDITNIIMNYNLPKQKTHKIHTRKQMYKIINSFGEFIENDYSLYKITSGDGRFYIKDFLKYTKIKKIEEWEDCRNQYNVN